MRSIILLATLVFPTTALAVPLRDEIRIDLPAAGHLKVRNDFGNVSVEVWENSYVAVSARIEGTEKFTRSPVIIDNRGTQFTITVVRRPIDPAATIHLDLKVPANIDITARSIRG